MYMQTSPQQNKKQNCDQYNFVNKSHEENKLHERILGETFIRCSQNSAKLLLPGKFILL